MKFIIICMGLSILFQIIGLILTSIEKNIEEISKYNRLDSSNLPKYYNKKQHQVI